jgi:AraC-like DNA-binding protein
MTWLIDSIRPGIWRAVFLVANLTCYEYDSSTMLTQANTNDVAPCKVRGCPIVFSHDTFAEWGASDFLMASFCCPTTIPEHEHFPLQLSLPVSGSCLHSFGPNRSTVLIPGQAEFIPSGETHGTRWLERGELITINAELEWCEENCDLAVPTLRKAKLETVDGRALQGILRHASELLRTKDRDELYIGSIGLTVTLGIFHQFGLRPRSIISINSPGPLRRVVRWIDEHFGEKITLVTLASVADCSQWHLIRLFDSFVGTSPARYVAARRLQKSRELLCAPGSDITEVALQCGFSSQSHFTRVFVRKYGEPPGAYRTAKKHSITSFVSPSRDDDTAINSRPSARRGSDWRST